MKSICSGLEKSRATSFLLFVFIAVLIFFTLSAFAKRPLTECPLTSKNEFDFYSAHQNAILDMGKNFEFQGLILNKKLRSSEADQIELYGFQETQSVGMTAKICLKISQRIFGTLERTSLKQFPPEIIFPKLQNKICRIRLLDTDPESVFTTRYLYVRYIRTRFYAFVFKFREKPLRAELDENDAFITELKERP